MLLPASQDRADSARDFRPGLFARAVGRSFQRRGQHALAHHRDSGRAFQDDRALVQVLLANTTKGGGK